MSPLFSLLTAGLLALVSCLPIDIADPVGLTATVQSPSFQEPDDPSRILNLLNGLIERVQKSSPILAAILKFLSVLVYLALNIKAWGPWVLVIIVIVVGFLIWQGWRKKQLPPVDVEMETEPEL